MADCTSKTSALQTHDARALSIGRSLKTTPDASGLCFWTLRRLQGLPRRVTPTHPPPDQCLIADLVLISIVEETPPLPPPVEEAMVTLSHSMAPPLTPTMRAAMAGIVDGLHVRAAST